MTRMINSLIWHSCLSFYACSAIPLLLLPLLPSNYVMMIMLNLSASVSSTIPPSLTFPLLRLRLLCKCVWTDDELSIIICPDVLMSWCPLVCPLPGLLCPNLLSMLFMSLVNLPKSLSYCQLFVNLSLCAHDWLLLSWIDVQKASTDSSFHVLCIFLSHVLMTWNNKFISLFYYIMINIYMYIYISFAVWSMSQREESLSLKMDKIWAWTVLMCRQEESTSMSMSRLCEQELRRRQLLKKKLKMINEITYLETKRKCFVGLALHWEQAILKSVHLFNFV